MKIKIFLILVVVFVLIGISFLLHYQTVCGPRGMGFNYNVLCCNKSCVIDDDCIFTCGCGAINKNEICHDEGIIYDCVDSEIKCKNNECTIMDISQKVFNICKERGTIECHGDCVDGFGEECYFDSTKYSKDDLIIGWTIPEHVTQWCFAIHSSSVCGNCYNKFEVRGDGELKEVSCEKFYQNIEDKNKSCDDCVDIISSGCC